MIVAEYEEKKEEEKFEFTPEGEALGYISLDQARILAMRTSREAPGEYGRRFRNVPMAFEVVEANETEDYYEVTLSFRPQGAFTGTQGQEQFFIEKEGNVAVRQVLSLPTAVGGRRFPVIPAAIGLVVVVIAAVVGVVFAAGGGGGSGETTAFVTPGPVAALVPTPTGVLASAAVVPAAVVIPTGTPEAIPKSTPISRPTTPPVFSPTPTGFPMGGPDLTASPQTEVPAAYTFLLEFGHDQTKDGWLKEPIGVAVDGDDYVYVLERSLVQKYAPDGTYLLTFGPITGRKGDENLVGDGDFADANAIAADTFGNVYVADKPSCGLKFNSDGVYDTSWPLSLRDGQLCNQVHGVAVDSSGNIYVADTRGRHRILKLTADGSLVGQIGAEPSGRRALSGTEPGMFFIPKGVAVDSAGNVYVVDAGNSRIQKFGPDGKYVDQWGSLGSLDGQFNFTGPDEQIYGVPAGIAVARSGNVYVADYGNHRIQVFTSDGEFVTKWGDEGGQQGQFQEPGDVAVDSSGNVYVSDQGGSRIQVFAPVRQPTSTLTQGPTTPTPVVIDSTATPAAKPESGAATPTTVDRRHRSVDSRRIEQIRAVWRGDSGSHGWTHPSGAGSVKRWHAI